MTLKRRSFLGLLGGGVISTILPPGTAQAVARRLTRSGGGYQRLLYGHAVAHAEALRGPVAANALSRRLGVSLDRAEALVTQMKNRGVFARIASANQANAVRKATTKASQKSEFSQPKQAQGESTMEKYTKFSGIAAPMPLVNIDTDMIIPKQFLKTIKRSGLGVNLFDEMRYDDDGAEIPEFVLNKTQYRAAEILIAGDNFGCGSSREHAPWALKDFGIKAIVSTSFADIFFNNCFKNGILPIVLPQDQVDALMGDAEKGSNARMEIDLEVQTITSSDGQSFDFEVDAFKKHCLLNGLDDIGLTMEKAASIDTFEAAAATARPWV